MKNSFQTPLHLRYKRFLQQLLSKNIFLLNPKSLFQYTFQFIKIQPLSRKVVKVIGTLEVVKIANYHIFKSLFLISGVLYGFNQFFLTYKIF